MNTEAIAISQNDIRLLLGAASGDAALLYLYINAGNLPENAARDLHYSESRLSCAAATLRQLGLWPEEKRSMIAPGERPQYSETDVLNAMDRDKDFRSL